MIQARGLTKSFPDRIVAVKDLDVEIGRGTVYGLIGKNGSGKTTALRLLLGLLLPDSGEARILGWDFWRAPQSVRSRVAYVSQSQHLPEALTLEELNWFLRRCNQRWDVAYARQLADRWALPWKQRLGSFSHGRQRQAALVLAFAGRPDVLILDEPAAGLDPIARRELLDQIVETLSVSDGCTVLLSTHLVGDLGRVADHIGIMDRGRLAMSLPLEALLGQIKRVQAIFPPDQPFVPCAVPGALSMARTGSVLNAVVRWTHDGELESWRASVDARIQVFPMELEEIFIELFGDHQTPSQLAEPEEKLNHFI